MFNLFPKKKKETVIKLMKFRRCYGVTKNGLPIPETLTTDMDEAYAFFSETIAQAEGKEMNSIVVAHKTITHV